MYDAFRVQLQDAADDGGALQTVSLYGVGGEELSRVHRVQPFGLSTHPPTGAHGIGLALHGRRDLVVALGLEHPDHRPRNVEAGGTVLYDAFGTAISLVRANLRMVHAEKVEVVCGAARIVMTKDGKVKVNS